MNIFNINPYIRYVNHSVIFPGTVLKPRVLFDYELVYIRSGELRLIYDGREYNCHDGQFIFIRPGIQHSFLVGDAPLYQPHIHFDMVYSSRSEETPISYMTLEDMTAKERRMISEDWFSGYPTEPFVTFQNKTKALKIFYRVIDSVGSPASYLVQKAAMTELLSMLIEDNFPDCFVTKEDHGIEWQIKNRIDSDEDFSLTLSDLEREFSYNRFHLEKRFKQRYGISIMAYRNNKRMELARKMLEKDSVSSVAYKAGYSSIYSFSRAFKLYFGVSPSQIGKVE